MKEALIQQKEWTADQKEDGAAGITLWVILSLPTHDTKLTGNTAPQDSTLMEAYGFLHAYLLATQYMLLLLNSTWACFVSQFKQGLMQCKEECCSNIMTDDSMSNLYKSIPVFTLLKSQSLLFQIKWWFCILGNGHLPSEHTIF